MEATSGGSVFLRPLADEDAATIGRWGADELFCRAAGWTVGLPPDAYVRFQQELISNTPRNLVRLGVQIDDGLVGYVDLHGDENGRRELGFVIGPRSLWRRGIGTRAALAGLVHGFTVMHLREIWAEALEANGASVAVLRKLGMTYTGPGTRADYAGIPSRYQQFSITADEFVSQGGPHSGAARTSAG